MTNSLACPARGSGEMGATPKSPTLFYLFEIRQMKPCNICGRDTVIYLRREGANWGWRICWRHLSQSQRRQFENYIRMAYVNGLKTMAELQRDWGHEVFDKD